MSPSTVGTIQRAAAPGNRAAWLRLLTCALVTAGAGCYESRIVEVDAGGPILASGDGQADTESDDPPVLWPEDCEVEFGIPTTLACTGLYEDMQSKRLGKGVRRFEPGARLWSDGLKKTRWIKLPEGKQIDTSNLDQWDFPAGTKAWKEFRRGDRRVETRMLVKKDDEFWTTGVYQWNEEGTAAKATRGGDIMVDGVRYHIPEVDGPRECDECHNGGADRLLGFDAIGLGLKGAEGVTLKDLVDEDLLSHPPKNTTIRIPDDGTGKAEEALGYMHVNCGVGCHSDNASANQKAKGTGMFLRLDVRALDDSPSEWDPIATTIGVPAKTPTFRGSTRIVPGDPRNSLIVRLTGLRNSKEQMPPLGTDVVDTDGRQKIIDWITAMAPEEMDDRKPDVPDEMDDDAGSGEPDASPVDAGMDADDADPVDAGVDDSDAGAPDAEAADAAAPDAEAADAEAMDDAQAAADAAAEDAGTPTEDADAAAVAEDAAADVTTAAP